MSKELEALNELKYECVNYEANIERFDIIETALKKQIIDDNEHPRKKGFNRDNRLRLAYQEMGKYSNSEEIPQELRGKPYGDIIGVVPEDEKGRWDLYLLFNIFLSRPIHNDVWDRDKQCFKKYPCLLEELENRGYDVKTIYFEISKRNKRKKYIPFKNFLRYGENYDFDCKTDQKKLKAFEIIKEKGLNLYKLKICDSVEEYNKLCNSALPLTQEEFNLLREVLK